jgi:hypothetical protein
VWFYFLLVEGESRVQLAGESFSDFFHFIIIYLANTAQTERKYNTDSFALVEVISMALDVTFYRRGKSFRSELSSAFHCNFLVSEFELQPRGEVTESDTVNFLLSWQKRFLCK